MVNEAKDYAQSERYKPYDGTKSIKQRLGIVNEDLQEIQKLDSRKDKMLKKSKLDVLSKELELANKELSQLHMGVLSTEVLEEVENLRKKCDELKESIKEINLTIVSIKPGINVVKESTPEPKDFIDHLPENVQNVKYKDTPDFTTLGDQKLTLIVSYSDGTVEEVDVNYKVIEKEGFFKKIGNRWKGLWNNEKDKDTAKNVAVGGALLVGGGIVGSRIEKGREERKAKREAKKAEREAKKAERKKKWGKGFLIGGILGTLGIGGYHIHKKIKEKEPSKKE